MKGNLRKIMKTAALAACVSLATSAAYADEWRMATPWSGGPWLERDAKFFADNVSELTHGDITVKVFPGGTLGSALKVTDTVKSGVATVSHNYINYDYGKDPTTALLAGSDIYSALERGVIDAAEWGSPEMNRPTGFQEVAKYVILPGIHQSGGVLECQVNQKAWDKLPAEEQDLIRQAAKLSMFDSWLSASYADLDAYKELVNGSNEIVRLDPKFISQILEETKKWENDHAADNAWFKRVLTSQREFKEQIKLWPEYRMQIGVTES
ncbi:C4-dicarboxylate ABC transporter substrate-binding protein [Vibrio furnissii]|uniref:C4-dicarboxylate ABC transporter substrate-binding protein n=1 Tax=Vibrio furnissii TaxID=29494 RepID=UPI001EEC8DD6|nr:C4-dicarboxylate ABC transporter substrate-binding protein [Vibrio furnissii]MCG6214764.1 C4-dicarboxylate ABC transporter substrate-binding protein [Vibrio furnissii]